MGSERPGGPNTTSKPEQHVHLLHQGQGENILVTRKPNQIKPAATCHQQQDPLLKVDVPYAADAMSQRVNAQTTFRKQPSLRILRYAGSAHCLDADQHKTNTQISCTTTVCCCCCCCCLQLPRLNVCHAWVHAMDSQHEALIEFQGPETKACPAVHQVNKYKAGAAPLPKPAPAISVT
jgi:hypothetical protein